MPRATGSTLTGVPDMPSAHIGGAPEFRDLARRLERLAGSGALNAAALRGIRAAVPALTGAAKASAAQRLPHRGGLAAQTARTRMTTTVRTGRRANVRITAEPNALKDPASADRGRIAHLTFGHGPLVFQNVRPGWFTDPMKAGAPAVWARVEKAVRAELKRL